MQQERVAQSISLIECITGLPALVCLYTRFIPNMKIFLSSFGDMVYPFFSHETGRQHCPVLVKLSKLWRFYWADSEWSRWLSVSWRSGWEKLKPLSSSFLGSTRLLERSSSRAISP